MTLTLSGQCPGSYHPSVNIALVFFYCVISRNHSLLIHSYMEEFVRSVSFCLRSKLPVISEVFPVALISINKFHLLLEGRFFDDRSQFVCPLIVVSCLVLM